jgi:flagellar basal-body rod modification protein FlgD
MEIATTRTNPFAAPAAADAAKKELGKDDFLRLLTTQLANQDPLKPMDNQAMIAQLAQFASVEQLSGMRQGLETLLVSQASQTQLSAATLVGREVRFRADGVDLPAEGAATFGAQLPSAAVVTVAIRDGAGRAVRTLALGPQDAGRLDLSWDGLDDSGRRAPAGRYAVTISGTAADGAPVTVAPLARGLVTGAAFGDEGPLLLVGGARVRLGDVLEIHQS